MLVLLELNRCKLLQMEFFMDNKVLNEQSLWCPLQRGEDRGGVIYFMIAARVVFLWQKKPNKARAIILYLHHDVQILIKFIVLKGIILGS